jgi:hypothetical protein
MIIVVLLAIRIRCLLPPVLGVWALDGVVVTEEASRAPRALAYGIVLFQSDPPDPMTNPPIEVELL